MDYTGGLRKITVNLNTPVWYVYLINWHLGCITFLCDGSDIKTIKCKRLNFFFRPAELTRDWENLSGCGAQMGRSSDGQTFDFSVMSYNILSQELLLSNAYLYKHCNPLLLDWEHRFTNIIKELEQHSADVSDFSAWPVFFFKVRYEHRYDQELLIVHQTKSQ